MENRKAAEENSAGWMSVPAFGDWDMKNGVPDYSMDFTKIREMRKQNKSDFSRASIGNEDELQHHRSGSRKVKVGGADDYSQLPQSPTRTIPDHSHSTRKKISSYFTCCIGA